MQASDLIASIAIHAAVVGTAAWIYRIPVDKTEDETIPAEMFFEVVEAASPEMADVQQDMPEPETPQEPAPESAEPEPADQTETELPEPELFDSQEIQDDLEVADAPESKDDPEIQDPPEPQPPPSPTASVPPPAPVADQEQAHVVSAPRALNRILPRYPRSARRKGHEGSVTVEVEVGENGEACSSGVVSSSGHRELDAAALDAVETIQFAPATKDGLNIRGRIRLTFDFRLQEAR